MPFELFKQISSRSNGVPQTSVNLATRGRFDQPFSRFPGDSLKFEFQCSTQEIYYRVIWGISDSYEHLFLVYAQFVIAILKSGPKSRQMAKATQAYGIL